ncbi:ectoine/hydroxyectoine ABC transporter permease subunit EhuD [Actinomadura barringtoniae]|uniref:Ectoine/hydroxyectoine ABC transporter permease subunit EhuD n=1 Tax=Actinomadura barringtoniae TaxID=1427535 RepID=A0A939T2I4_9ACTN|nr:ectoine/hydroxyectoine ABC transporter permease subunit EhuD [Actinomadura barringtoniae]MBO2449691.1 ectoine/hydroxyectoine ABC transporter permease subunit EhuD [Actinomadura barringtoniae]
MSWDWNLAGHVVSPLLSGLKYTLGATVLGYLLALALGLVWAILRRSPNIVVNQVVRWVVEFIRSTPLLVQLAFLFYALPEAGFQFSPFWTGVIGLGTHYSTYISEVYRAGIEDVPRGQWEACTALNLPRRRVWFGVVLPQAVRKVIPTLGNYLIALFKDTPLLLVITVPEMMSRATTEAGKAADYLEPLTMAAAIFVIVSVLSSVLIRRLEGRYATH